MNKRITIKKIMLWLYAMLLSLPLIQVGFRCAYVALNKNAYESYYGETINQKEYNNITTIQNNKEYHYISSEYSSLFQNNNNEYLVVEGLKNVYANVTSIYNSLIQAVNCKYIYFVNNQTTNPYLRFNDENNTTIVNVAIQTATIEFDIYVLEQNNIQNDVISLFRTIEYNNYSYLDNAFDYSLSEFIENNNTGLIDFVGLFSGMFLGSANVENSLYLGFANFMMNYALFISCAYFVFEVLMWFINYCRKWLYAFEEKGGAE